MGGWKTRYVENLGENEMKTKWLEHCNRTNRQKQNVNLKAGERRSYRRIQISPFRCLPSTFVMSIALEKKESNWDDIMLSGTGAFRNIITSSNIEVPQYIRGFNRWYDMTAYSTALKVNLSSSALALFWSSKNDRVMLWVWAWRLVIGDWLIQSKQAMYTFLW